MRKLNKEVFVEKVWGGRRLASLFGKKLPKGKSIGECWLHCGKVVVKLLDVKRPLSIQVHPKGKSELWYVIEAGQSSRMLGGIALEEYRVKKGDWIYIPAGTVHTILPPAVLLEVSQKSFITYRLYDWGRGTRPLDIEEGLRALDIIARPKIYRNINSFKCPYFNIQRGRQGDLYIVLKRGQAFVTKERAEIPKDAVVFSVNWTTKSSRISRSGIA